MRVKRHKDLHFLKELLLVLARQQNNNVQVLGYKQESIRTICPKI